jgi:hypothetical protein
MLTVPIPPQQGSDRRLEQSNITRLVLVAAPSSPGGKSLAEETFQSWRVSGKPLLSTWPGSKSSLAKQ